MRQKKKERYSSLCYTVGPCCSSFFFFFKIYLFIVGCAGSSLLGADFLVLGSGGYSLVAVHRLLLVVASFIAEHGL